jgi:hypothetical protein
LGTFLGLLRRSVVSLLSWGLRTHVMFEFWGFWLILLLKLLLINVFSKSHVGCILTSFSNVFRATLLILRSRCCISERIESFMLILLYERLVNTLCLRLTKFSPKGINHLLIISRRSMYLLLYLLLVWTCQEFVTINFIS